MADEESDEEMNRSLEKQDAKGETKTTKYVSFPFCLKRNKKFLTSY